MNFNHPTAKPVVLCADDYGIAPGVGRGIRALAAAGRLSATSCMTVFAEWCDEASRLADATDRIDVGLHLTLTDHAPLGGPGRPVGGRPARPTASRLERRDAALRLWEAGRAIPKTLSERHCRLRGVERPLPGPAVLRHNSEAAVSA